VLLTKQTKNPYLKRITFEMKENIDHWINVHETMERYPKVFDSLTVALIWVWEKTGQLGKILTELDNNLLENIETRWKVKWAMVYPAILITLTIGMTIFMMVFIVPKITDAFLQTWVTLPALTQVVVNISSFVIHDWKWLILWIISIIIIIKIISSTYFGKIAFANIAVKFPIFGYIVRQSNIVYFIKSFTILLDSWVLLLESLKTSSNVVPNLAYKNELIRVKNEVELGLTISKSLWLNTDYDDSVYLNPLFPEDFAFVVNTWEETWSLSSSLKRIWDNYNWELKRYIWNLSSMMEPVIIIIVGALVGTIVIAIMLPFFEIWKVVQQL
jgi:type IV pilus assembly protein PilC